MQLPDQTLLVLACGGIAYWGSLGLGEFVLSMVGWKYIAGDMWRRPASLLAGLLLWLWFAMFVGLAGLVDAVILPILWLLIMVSMSIYWFRRNNDFSVLRRVFSGGDTWFRVGIAFFAVVVATTLLYAAAPSSKIDEIYYHMPLAKRILEEGALNFMTFPWQSAILPQMMFQIGNVFFHGLGLPDAGNVFSALLGLELMFFAYRIHDSRARVAWLYLVMAMYLGLHSAIWWATSGAHAMGDLGSALLFVGVFLLPGHDDIPRVYRLLLMSIFGVVAVASKVSLGPVTVVGLMLYLISEDWRGLDVTSAWKSVFVLLAPWLLFFAPICLYTWSSSGSPFGPMLVGLFGSNVYDVTMISEMFARITSNNAPTVFEFAKHSIPSYSWPIWVGWLAFLFLAQRGERIKAGLLLVVGLLVITFLTQFDLRFLGGLFWALSILGALKVFERWNLISFRNVTVAIVGLLSLPWLGLRIVYSEPFFTSGWNPSGREEFRHKMVAFTQDFIELDQRLPSNAVLVYSGVRLSSLYSPRPAYPWRSFPRDGAMLYLFGVGETLTIPDGFVVSDLIYENREAVQYVMRQSGKFKRTRLRVYRMIRK